MAITFTVAGAGSDCANFAGHVLYHGPRGEVMGFFQSLGFDIPARKGIPDFLQEVSGRKDQQVHDPLLFLHVADLT